MGKRLFVLALLMLAMGAGSAAAAEPPAGPAASPAAASAGPPVIHESFTLLPCSPSTTLGMEGCAEHRVLAEDHRINREMAVIYRLLTTATARRHLAAASATWLAYRRADCTSQADTYAGGSEALVAYVECLVQADGARTVNLRAFYKELSQGNATAPAFP